MIGRPLQTTAFILLVAASCLAQSPGRVKGVVRSATGAAAPNVVVIIQSSRKITRVTTNADGSYSVKLPAGAYRLTLDQPHTRFSTKIKTTATSRSCAATRSRTLSSNRTKNSRRYRDRATAGGRGRPQRRETPDRWRIVFPEYDRYGDRGARGRDIPFKRGRWWDPYNQNVLKGDYPIKGDKLFMILTAVSATNVEQRRAPTPSGVSSVDPQSAEFFGRPEEFAAAETLQFSFELFHGDTTFKPRDWAIKFSPTFSVPNYLNARENGVVNIDVRRGTTALTGTPRSKKRLVK